MLNEAPSTFDLRPPPPPPRPRHRAPPPHSTLKPTPLSKPLPPPPPFNLEASPPFEAPPPGGMDPTLLQVTLGMLPQRAGRWSNKRGSNKNNFQALVAPAGSFRVPCPVHSLSATFVFPCQTTFNASQGMAVSRCAVWVGASSEGPRPPSAKRPPARGGVSSSFRKVAPARKRSCLHNNSRHHRFVKPAVLPKLSPPTQLPR